MTLRALVFAAVLAASPARAQELPPPDGVAARARLEHLEAPWYDAAKDTWRPVQARAPEAPPPDLPAPPQLGGLVTVVAWLLAAVLLAALIWLVWQALPRSAPVPEVEPEPEARPRSMPSQLVAPLAGEPDDPEAALAHARASGNAARAVVWLYALLLQRLDRAGIVQLRRGATNRRYQREVTDWQATAPDERASVRAALDAAIVAFERAYFGQQAVGMAQVDALESQVRAAIATLPRSGGAP